jgi:hypothetical protein
MRVHGVHKVHKVRGVHKVHGQRRELGFGND